MQWSCAKIREAFLNYFEQQEHTVVRSSALVPANDNTLLFTNAGMVQFKDLFLGLESRSYTRATTSQRCVRAGGKHNDLENVGYTARHHTFFEMLGNFSFGDYFKRDAIRFAWDFLTVVLELPAEKLWVTVFEEDDEAADIWLKEIGVDASRFSRIGAKDNFWAMGDTGPCGPCSEIFYDHGEAVPGGPPGTPDEDGDRYIEIWNLVFMQYDRSEDGTLTPLPKPSVDTGMGLERLAAILQGVHSNYDIDLFQTLISQAAKLTGATSHESKSLRVIADHIRASAFLVADGVYPSNVGRGFVLRRIIRRAVRHGYMLGMRQPFFYKLVATLGELMGDAFPELVQKQALIERILHQEEERFGETIDQGMRMLEQALAEGDGCSLSGEILFKLYDTYGFPVDLTADIARERNITLDLKGFEVFMNRQRDMSRQRSGDQFKSQQSGLSGIGVGTDFRGYIVHRCEGQIAVLLNQDSEFVDLFKDGDRGGVVLDQTPFYAESGGQVGDQGRLYGPKGALFIVEDTRKLPGDVIIHLGYLESGELKGGDPVEARIDEERRAAIRLNHTATHLLHAALRQVLGEHVAQKGSKVDVEHLRFDFSHFEPVSTAQICQIESLVNEQIRVNHVAETRLMKFDDAIKSGAIALFDEKYGEDVRVLRLGDFSTELCGGTHVDKSGDIGLFKITQESGIASGVRRIEAVTGEYALNLVWKHEEQLAEIAQLLKCDQDSVAERLRAQLEKSRHTEKELERMAAQLASRQGSDLLEQAATISGVKVLATRVDNPDVKALRELMDQLKNKLGSAVVALGAVDGQKVTLLVGVTDDQTGRLDAGALVGQMATYIDGRGGGKRTMAQAGGSAPEGLDKALQQLEILVRDQLG